MLVTVYGPTHEEKEEQFLSELANICSNIKIPTLIGGDFNILRFSGEKNRNFCHNRFTDMFNWIINTFELRDLNLNGGMYTWSNNQADPTLERLDRVLISPEWEALFPLTNLRKTPRFLSDHNPLILCSDQEKNRKTKQFFFETSWVKHPDFIPKVKEIWGKHVIASSAVEKWGIKLNRVKKFLKGWGMNIRGHNRKIKAILQEELMLLEKEEENSPLPAHLLNTKTFIQTTLLRILEEEELYWHKRSNLNWLL
jgi:hypothetical protein